MVGPGCCKLLDLPKNIVQNQKQNRPLKKINIIFDVDIFITLNAARRAQRRVNGHEMKSNGSGKEVSEKRLGTFTRLLIPTEDQKIGVFQFL